VLSDSCAARLSCGWRAPRQPPEAAGVAGPWPRTQPFPVLVFVAHPTFIVRLRAAAAAAGGLRRQEDAWRPGVARLSEWAPMPWPYPRAHPGDKLLRTAASQPSSPRMCSKWRLGHDRGQALAPKPARRTPPARRSRNVTRGCRKIHARAAIAASSMLRTRGSAHRADVRWFALVAES
jgi:hypothetical protein